MPNTNKTKSTSSPGPASTIDAVKEILHRIDAVENKKDIIERLFGAHAGEARQERPVILFGAGDLGRELHHTLSLHGVPPAAFCDNDASRSGETFCGRPVLSFDELKASHRQSLVVIASQKYGQEILAQLFEHGFEKDLIFCRDRDADTQLLLMFSTVGTQNVLEGHKTAARKKLIDVLVENSDEVARAYDLLADQRSKDLFVSKLALLASSGSFELFKEFMLRFSEPIREFDFFGYEGTPEDYFYFNNDVIALEDDEIYLDVGAYDGDTVTTFVETCRKNDVDYRRIFAFEPDPICYAALEKNTADYKNISLHKQGLWSETTTLRFVSSGEAVHDQAGILSDEGDIEVDVVSIDDFLKGDEKITFIKMDPGGNVIPQAIRGAARTIREYRPKLALGAYHAFESIWEIPLLVHEINPEYKLYLRHNTYHLCDTALYAVQE